MLKDIKPDLLISSNGLNKRRSVWKGMPAVTISGNYRIIRLGIIHLLRFIWCSMTLKSYTILIVDDAKIVEDNNVDI